MFFEHRALWLAKDAQQPNECQDAFAIDDSGGVAAIADGVSSTLFARRWARLLVEGVVASPPDVCDAAAFDAWVDALRSDWAASVESVSLAWHQKAKIRDGAAATLLWVEMNADHASRQTGPFHYTCRAVGDCCLFHVRGNAVVRSFPMEGNSTFTNYPPSLCSVRRGAERPPMMELKDKCWPGDCLALCTDALAEWILARLKEGSLPPFLEWWEMREDRFGDWLGPLREAKTIRSDDTTLVLLRVLGGDGQAPAGNRFS